jgi:DNA-directed RNA polymerase subunit alpha
MDAVVELDELLAKDAWSLEDVQKLQQTLPAMREPARRLREAVSRFNSANPAPSGAAALKLGICRYLLCQFVEALELLNQATDNKERRFYQALCHKQLHQWRAALDNLQRAEDKGWEARQAALEMAEVQCLAGNLEAAAKALDRFAKKSQENPDWHHVNGLLQQMLGNYEPAVREYERARRLRAGHTGATFRLAYYHDLHGDEDQAAELYRECISHSEQAGESAQGQAGTVLVSALMNLAVLYEDKGRYDEAARCLRRVLAGSPNHGRARLFLKDVLASKTMSFDEEEAKRLARRNDLLAIPITDFELSVRARNCLKKMNIRTLGDLLHVNETDLLSYKNFGETSLAEIKVMLSSKGLRLGQLREDADAVLVGEPEPAAPATVSNDGMLATPLGQIEFSVRSRKALERLGVKTLGELATKTEAELLACRNFGQTSLNEVQQRLAEYGLRLRESS